MGKFLKFSIGETFKMKIAIFQYAPVWEDKEANMQKLRDMAAAANCSGGLMVFPELTLTGFTMRSRSFAEDSEGPTTMFFSELARKYRAHVFGGLIKAESGKFYNCLLHLDNNGVLRSVYRKIHPFSFSGENRFYKGGRQAVITRVGEVETGMTICFDLRFPELYRHYGKARTPLIINIANWPSSRIYHWETLLEARAIENQCFVVGANRVGNDRKNAYNGHSMVIHPFGEQILQAGGEEGVYTVDVDINEVMRVRSKYPFLDDMVLI